MKYELPIVTFQRYCGSALSHGVTGLALVDSPVSVAHLGLMMVFWVSGCKGLEYLNQSHLWMNTYISNIEDGVELAGCRVWPGADHEVFLTGHQLWRLIIIPYSPIAPWSPEPSLYQAVSGAGQPLTSQPSLAVLPTSTSSSGLTADTSGPTINNISVSVSLQIRSKTYTWHSVGWSSQW